LTDPSAWSADCLRANKTCEKKTGKRRERAYLLKKGRPLARGVGVLREEKRKGGKVIAKKNRSVFCGSRT